MADAITAQLSGAPGETALPPDRAIDATAERLVREALANGGVVATSIEAVSRRRQRRSGWPLLSGN